MKATFRQTQLYKFLLYCNGEGLNKRILDLGAGGNCPPLAIFKEHGYETHGIEISEKQIELAREFEKKHNLNLGIKKGDMLNTGFEDDSFEYVYSFNSVFHMSKKQVGEAIKEMRRITKTGGFVFVNFASTNDMRATQGRKEAEGETWLVEHGEEVLHSFFDENEPKKYFEGFEVLYKENRVIEVKGRNNQEVKVGFVDYILKKI